MRRLNSTRSTFSGAHRALTSSATVGARPMPRRRASASTPRRHEPTTGSSSASRSSSVSAPASIRASSNRSSTSERQERDLLAEDGCRRSGVDEPVLERLQHRLHVRERRAEVVARPRDELPACVEQALEARGHLVERRGQVGDLGGPGLGRADAEVSRGELRGGVADALDRARRSTARGPGRRSRRRSPTPAETARIFTSSPMWNATQPGEQHRREREADGERGEAGELQPEAREEAKKHDRARARPRA